MDVNEILSNITSITFYYAEIESCSGSNLYTIGNLKIRLEDLEGYIGLTKDAING